MAAMIIQACTDTAYTYVTLPNDMPESPPTAKCQQLNQQVCNGAAQVTTSKDLMEVVRPIIFFNIGTVANILIADQQRIIDQQGQTLTERDEKIAQLKRTISKQQHALDEQERMIARSSGHAHRIEHHLRQAVTIAGLIVEAPNGAATDNGAAPRNTNTDDDTRDGADPDDNDALDDADPNDDYVLDSDDAQENGNIQDNDDTQDSADPDDDDAPANQVTDSPPVAKRPRVDRQVRDDSEQVLANKDLLEVVGPIIFIDVDVLAGLYELVKNRQLIPAGVEARAFARRLEGLESFTRWKPRFSAVESATHTDLNVICRSNRELDSLRPKVLRQLGLAKKLGSSGGWPAPLLRPNNVGRLTA
ncbi:hypothetical protein GGI01_000203 [Coemansia sp. RSA 376]|nr:hypothetical protein IW146_007108 [Coemansia sp. RSA 922]KAJ2264074.1 hypothetical protein GGI01_000203 [Coemansia sp. RSA 376]